jgi:hypothetical protein
MKENRVEYRRDRYMGRKEAESCLGGSNLPGTGR